MTTTKQRIGDDIKKNVLHRLPGIITEHGKVPPVMREHIHQTATLLASHLTDLVTPGTKANIAEFALAVEMIEYAVAKEMIKALKLTYNIK